MARGRKRVHKEARSSVTYYLPTALIKKLKTKAKKADSTASDFLVEILKKELGKRG